MPIKTKTVRKARQPKLTRKLIGQVGVDSGQLMVCDPGYIDGQWKKRQFTAVSLYQDVTTGKFWHYTWGKIRAKGTRFPGNYGTPIPELGNKSPNELIASKQWVEQPNPSPYVGEFSYAGACHTTIDDCAGPLGGNTAVAFRSGYGDGCYNVYGFFNKEGRCLKVEIIMDGGIGAELLGGT